MTSITPNTFIRSDSSLNKSFEQAASGRRINSAADDAAGSAIASRFSSQISASQQAQRNGLDANSLIETEDGALQGITSGLERLQELVVQQGNGILNDSDRAALSKEAEQITAQISDTLQQASFNGKQLFPSTNAQGSQNNPSGNQQNAEISFQLGDKAGDQVSLQVSDLADNLSEGLAGLDFASSSGEDTEQNLDILANLQQDVSSRRTELGAVSNRVDSTIDRLANEEENAQAARSRIQDGDFAKIVSELIVGRIRQDAQIAAQAQANISAQDTLRLLS